MLGVLKGLWRPQISVSAVGCGAALPFVEGDWGWCRGGAGGVKHSGRKYEAK